MPTGAAIAPNSKIRTPDKVRCEVVMADSSTIRLNYNSEVTIGSGRDFTLASGQMYSSVAKADKEFTVSVAQASITADDLDWFVPHQANKRIIDASARKLGIAEEKVVTTVDLHGNTSAASVPLALAVAVADGRIKRGDLVLLEAMGGGFTWGAVLVRW